MASREFAGPGNVFTASSLAEALRAWMAKGGPLSQTVDNHSNLKVATEDDVLALRDALDALLADPALVFTDARGYFGPIYTLAGYCEEAAPECIESLTLMVLPRLRSLVRAAVDGSRPDVTTDDVVFIARQLAWYRQVEDVELIAKLARNAAHADTPHWTGVFRIFAKDHPHGSRMLDALRSPLPAGFAAVAYLDFANGIARKGSFALHPFTTTEGRQRIAAWLTDTDPDNFSYARSATAALPYLGTADSTLLDLAARHPHPAVRMESVWAAAKLGDRTALAHLVELCLDPHQSTVAQRYLEELGHGDRIPAACREDKFAALSLMSEWLAHPQELGKPPTSIEVYDYRSLKWPPTRDLRSVALVKFVSDGEVGIGMVGSITFALFGEATASMSPEDIYALHCCWELQTNKDPRAPSERSVAAGRSILARHNAGF